MADETPQNDTNDEPQAQVTPETPEVEETTPKADEVATETSEDVTAEAADVEAEDDASEVHDHDHDVHDHEHSHAAPVTQVRGGARADARRARRSQQTGAAITESIGGSVLAITTSPGRVTRHSRQIADR